MVWAGIASHLRCSVSLRTGPQRGYTTRSGASFERAEPFERLVDQATTVAPLTRRLRARSPDSKKGTEPLDIR